MYICCICYKSSEQSTISIDNYIQQIPQNNEDFAQFFKCNQCQEGIYCLQCMNQCQNSNNTKCAICKTQILPIQDNNQSSDEFDDFSDIHSMTSDIQLLQEIDQIFFEYEDPDDYLYQYDISETEKYQNEELPVTFEIWQQQPFKHYNCQRCDCMRKLFKACADGFHLLCIPCILKSIHLYEVWVYQLEDWYTDLEIDEQSALRVVQIAKQPCIMCKPESVQHCSLTSPYYMNLNSYQHQDQQIHLDVSFVYMNQPNMIFDLTVQYQTQDIQKFAGFVNHLKEFFPLFARSIYDNINLTLDDFVSVLRIQENMYRVTDN